MTESIYILELHSYTLLSLYNVTLNNSNFKNIRASSLHWGKSSLQCPFKGCSIFTPLELTSASQVLTSSAREKMMQTNKQFARYDVCCIFYTI